MLILTYHIVRAEPMVPGGGFYDVPLAWLGAQIDALRARGLAPLDPAVAADDAARRGYLLTFDDGTRDHFEIVRNALRERGERGIFFIPTAKIGTAGFVTAEEVRTLAAEGHVIGCHGHEHRRLDTFDEAALREQLTTALDILQQLTGERPVWFAPPGGFIGAALRRAAQKAGLRAIRTMEWGLNRRPRLDALQCLPLNRHLDMTRFGRILDGRGLTRLRTLYFAKQALKMLVPLRWYERGRAAIFRSSRRVRPA